MTDPVSLALALATLGVAAVVAAKMHPSVHVVDNERWFKSLLFTLDSRPERVLYHPLGRFAERKLDPMPVDVFPEEPLPGEAELLRRLRPLLPEERWQALFEDPLGAAALAPEAMEPKYRLETRFGIDASNESFKAWSRGDHRFLLAVQRRVPLRWAWLGEHAWARAFHEVLGDKGENANVESIGSAILGSAPGDRWVLFASEVAFNALMRILHSQPALRDRVVAVVAVDAPIVDSEDWWEAHFLHDEMDTELNRATLYASLAILTPETVDKLAQKRFPRPGGERSFSWMEIADLGAVGENTPPEAVIRALTGYLAGWVVVQDG